MPRDILVRGATGYNRLPIGTEGQVLTVSGGTAVWANPPGGLSGSGTVDRVAKFTGITSLGDSNIISTSATIVFDNNLFHFNLSPVKMGIGFGSEISALHILKDGLTGGAVDATIIQERYSSDIDGGLIIHKKARGTFSAPLAILAGDIIGGLQFEGYYGGGFDEAARIEVVVPVSWSTTVEEADLIFSLVKNSSPNFPLTQRFKIKGAGGFTFYTIDGNIALEINNTGFIKAGDGSAGGPAYTFLTDLTTGMYLQGFNSLGFSAGGVSYIILQSNKVIIDSGIKLINRAGSALEPSITFASDEDTGFFSPVADTVSITTGSVERYRVNNVGDLVMQGNFNFIPAISGQGRVGTSTNKFSEVNALTVNAGDIKFSNGYYFTEIENGVALCRPDGTIVASWS